MDDDIDYLGVIGDKDDDQSSVMKLHRYRNNCVEQVMATVDYGTVISVNTLLQSPVSELGIRLGQVTMCTIKVAVQARR